MVPNKNMSANVKMARVKKEKWRTVLVKFMFGQNIWSSILTHQ